MNYFNHPNNSIEEVFKGKILVVDDEETNVKLLEHLLIQNGFRSVRCTTDPMDAVDIYQQFNPDLVLLNLNMPYRDGVQVMEKLQEIEKETYPSIIVFTADNSDEAKIRSLVSGALDFLGKPFDIVEVMARIRNMLNVRLLHNRVNFQNKILDQKIGGFFYFGEGRPNGWAFFSRSCN